MLRSSAKRLRTGDTLGNVLTPTIAAGLPPAMILTPASPEFAVSGMIGQITSGGVWTSAAWPSANDPIGVEFWLTQPVTVYQLGWMNGSGTMTDSCDVGIYDTTNVRKVSAGGTARSGVSSLQFVDVTDTPLLPGRYKLVMSNNGTTANQQQVWTGPANALVWGMFGLLDSATDAYPLPDPITNLAAAAVATVLPVMCISLRTLV